MQDIAISDKILQELHGTSRRDIEDLTRFMLCSDFFKAPASTSHHLAVPGGLAVHSWNVYQALKQITKDHILVASRDSVIICGLLHDICKANFYKPDTRNKKINGVWQSIPFYTVDEQDPLGHGEKSVIILQRYIELSQDEALAIRWHMGAWDAESYGQRKALNRAMETCQLLRALMLADQLSTYFLEPR